jgi:hypothetical protein
LAEIQQNHRHYYAIDSSVIDNRNALDITSMAIFNRIWSYSSMSPNPSVIVVNDPFLLLQNGLIGQYIQPFITNRESGNRFFIFNINSTKEENFHDNFSRQEFFAHCDTQIHLSDCCATEKYAAIFNLSNAELYAIQNLSKNPNGAIIKQNGLVAPISINADSIFEDIADIMCDTIDVKRQFEAIRANIPAGESVIDKFLNKDSLTKTQDQIMAERLAKEQEALQQKQQADKDLANQILNAA